MIVPALRGYRGDDADVMSLGVPVLKCSTVALGV